MKLPALALLGALPSLILAYSPPREPGVYLGGAYAVGNFLYDIGGSKPRLSRFDEAVVSFHGMRASESASGFRFGGGMDLGFESIDQMDCSPTECFDDGSEWEKNRTIVFSPFLRFELPMIGLQAGAHLSKIGIPLPRLGLRLGSAEKAYVSVEIMNGRTLLAEGLLKAGIGGSIGRTGVWAGLDKYPFKGVGLGLRASRSLGPLQLILGGRVGRGEVHYVDKYGDDPSIHAERTEVSGTIGFEFQIPD